MTAGEFADLVGKMRYAQKAFSRTHSKDSLQLSKDLEKQVDEILAERRKRETERQNPSLFGGIK